jgi:lipopolysaccharide export LptBFGC system permease protein LptF
LILFQAEKFIVKTHVFMLGSVFGIILGHLLSQLINSCRKKKKLVRYNEEENVALKSEKQTFSISEDDDDTDEESKEKNKDDNMVTIELNNLN